MLFYYMKWSFSSEENNFISLENFKYRVKQELDILNLKVAPNAKNTAKNQIVK